MTGNSIHRRDFLLLRSSLASSHNTSNGQAIMANTVESYGRAKHVDAYREAFGRLKDAIIDTSLPPPIETKYPDVWSNSLQHPDGTKLLIGTQVSDHVQHASRFKSKAICWLYQHIVFVVIFKRPS
jgi:hypothetical protein